MKESPQKRNVWFTLLVLLFMLPVFAYPSLLSAMPEAPDDTVHTLMLAYPLYVVGSGVCAWLCWPSRKTLSWILLALLLLSHAAMWVLATMPAAQ